jgi:ORF6N domain
MLDADLAALYQVPTKALNQAFRRNLERFPEDFAFQLSKNDLENWRSQIVTSNSSAKMGLRRPPYAFTQEGIAMLSSVLRSERAVQMNIAIMRAFVRMRELMATHKDIAARVERLERGQERAAASALNCAMATCRSASTTFACVAASACRYRPTLPGGMVRNLTSSTLNCNGHSPKFRPAPGDHAAGNVPA